MKTFAARLLAAWVVALMTAASYPARAGAAAPADQEHREVLLTDAVRVALLVLDPGSATPQHTHTNPHLAAALVAGDLVDLASDGTERRREMAEGALAFVPSGVTHAIRNAGDAPFRAVTIDLLRPQTGARNRCGALVPDQPIDCPAASSKNKHDQLVPQMETDQAQVSLLTLAPGAEHTFKAAATPPVVVALAGTRAKALVEIKIPGGATGKGEKPLAGGDAATSMSGTPLMIRNTGSGPARLVVVEFR